MKAMLDLRKKHYQSWKHDDNLLQEKTENDDSTPDHWCVSMLPA